MLTVECEYHLLSPLIWLINGENLVFMLFLHFLSNFDFFLIVNILSLCLGTFWASDLQGITTSVFPKSDTSDFGEYPVYPLFFNSFGSFSMFFIIPHIVFVYLGNSGASESHKSSISIFFRSCMSDLGEYSACGLLFRLFCLFSVFFYDS